MPRVLIVAPSWIGDSVLAHPLIRRLHERLPEALIDVFAPTWVAPVFRHMPEVNEIIDNRFKHGELRLLDRRRAAKQLARRRYDQAIVLPNSVKSALVPFFAGIKLRTGFQGEMRRGLLNDVRALDEKALPLMVERFAYLAERPNSALQRPVPNPRLSVEEAARRATVQEFAPLHRGPIAAFCPGAEYGPAKRWPPQYFAQCATRLASEGYLVWALGSNSDRGAGAEIESLSAGACRNLCGETSLTQAINLIASANLVLTNDSGLMHIAAALDRPMLALFGSSSPRFTPPLSAKAKVLNLNLECSPCFKRECPLQHFNCMIQLTPEKVLQSIPST